MADEDRKVEREINDETAELMRRVFTGPDGTAALVQLLDWMGYYEMQPSGDGPTALNNLAKFLVSVLGVNQPWNARAIMTYALSLGGSQDPRKGYTILQEEDL